MYQTPMPNSVESFRDITEYLIVYFFGFRELDMCDELLLLNDGQSNDLAKIRIDTYILRSLKASNYARV